MENSGQEAHMTQAHKSLYIEIAKLPLEKVGKALSFIRYLEQEAEPELLLDPAEELELHQLLANGSFVNASEVLEKIKALPDDSI